MSRLVPWLIFAAVALAGSLFFDRELPSDPVPTMQWISEPCTPTEPALVASAGRYQNGEYAIFSPGLVHQRVCEAGVVTFTARGSAARGHGAHLVVSLQDQVLWEGEVLEPREFEIPVPGPGWLTLAFVNDYYDPPEDRNLWISELRFEPYR